VLRRRQLIRDALGAAPGERVMDVGCGPGFYVAELLEQVGSDGSVVGIDSSQPMLAIVSLHTADPARTERILRAWDGHLAHRSLPQTLTRQLRTAGFDDVELEGHTFATNKLDPEIYGGFLVPDLLQPGGEARAAVQDEDDHWAEATLVGRDGISKDEADAWEAEQRELAQRSEFFFACIQFCFTATRAG
jgi:SAM-dependent methyltransferase